MGWTFTYKNPNMSVREFFEQQFNINNPAKNIYGKIIGFSATWTTAYIAYEFVQNGERKVFAFVCLLRHVPKAKDGYNFGYKDMDESMGPCEYKCPKTILKMLTPTEHEYAKEWRKRCWDRIEKRAKMPKVKKGDWIKFSKPITFIDGSCYDTLRFDRGSRFETGSYLTFRIRNWRDREFVKVNPPNP